MKKIIGVILMVALLLSLGMLTACELSNPPAAGTAYIAKDGASDYSVVYSNEGVIHYNKASVLWQVINNELGIYAEKYEAAEKTTDKEVLFGKTDRALSVELAAAVDAAVSADKPYAYGYGYKDGKLAFYANSEKALEYAWGGFYALLRAEEGAISCADNLWVVESFGDAEYSEYLNTLVPYYITYELNGGVGAGSFPTIYNYGTGLELPANAKRPDYKFVGWYGNSEFRGPAITKIPADLQADITIYAKWEKVVGYVDYVLGGGAADEGVELPTRWNYGTALTLVNGVSKLGSAFAGWYDNADFEGDPITEIPADCYEDITLYAKWNKTAGMITYVTNGGTIVGEYEQLKADGVAVTLPTAVNKPNYVFIGWYDNAQFTGNAITALPAAGMDDYTLYAKYDGAVKEIVNKAASNYVWGAANFGPDGTYDLGTAMIAAGTTKATIRIDTASTGSSGWTAGLFRLRPGQVGTDASNKQSGQINIINFANGYMQTLNKVNLTAANSGDVVDIVIDFSIKTIYYYVNGELKATETSGTFNTDLLCYDYITKATGYTYPRGNFIQLSSFSGVLQCDFMGLYVGEWITAPAAA